MDLAQFTAFLEEVINNYIENKYIDLELELEGAYNAIYRQAGYITVFLGENGPRYTIKIEKE